MAKAKGKKLAIYVSGDDMDVVDGIEDIVNRRKIGGFRTSFSFELVRLARVGLKSAEATKGLD